MHLIGPSSQIKATKFFGVFGIIFIIFGASVPLFDLMHNAILSAITGLIGLTIGGCCSMSAVGNFLQHIELDEES